MLKFLKNFFNRKADGEGAPPRPRLFGIFQNALQPVNRFFYPVFKWKKTWKALLTVVGLVLIVQVSYFTGVYESLTNAMPPADMIVIYSGQEDRMIYITDWATQNPKSLFLFSGFNISPEAMEKFFRLGGRMLVEDKARTTDQNARYCAPIIKQSGVHSVVLALPWYHLPRALFLTRYYLRDSGVMVHAFASDPLPKQWWLDRSFYFEIIKFWGSLVRIGLSRIGIEKWPKPSGGY